MIPSNALHALDQLNITNDDIKTFRRFTHSLELFKWSRGIQDTNCNITPKLSSETMGLSVQLHIHLILKSSILLQDRRYRYVPFEA